MFNSNQFIQWDRWGYPSGTMGRIQDSDICGVGQVLSEDIKETLAEYTDSWRYK